MKNLFTNESNIDKKYYEKEIQEIEEFIATLRKMQKMYNNKINGIESNEDFSELEDIIWAKDISLKFIDDLNDILLAVISYRYGCPDYQLYHYIKNAKDAANDIQCYMSEDNPILSYLILKNLKMSLNTIYQCTIKNHFGYFPDNIPKECPVSIEELINDEYDIAFGSGDTFYIENERFPKWINKFPEVKNG